MLRFAVEVLNSLVCAKPMTGDAYNIKTSYAFFTDFQARRVPVLSSSSSRARSKRVLNQTMLNDLDPLIVLVLLA